MKSFTRIGLPILVVVGVVFGITFVRLNSPDEPAPADSPKPARTSKAKPDVLTFPIVTVAPVSSQPEPGRESLALWDPQVEVGAPGHFEFWAHNTKKAPVTVKVYSVNCQCAGVEVTSVPQEAYKEYATGSVLAAGPLCATPPLLAAITHATFSQKLQWLPMLANTEQHDQVIPAADPAAGSQVAIFRLGWTGKGEPGTKYIKAYLMAVAGEEPPGQYTLEVTTMVVPSFDLVRRDGPNGWAPLPDLSLGELRENAEVTRQIYLLSTTRRQHVFRMSVDQPDPCLTWTEPVPASAEETEALADSLRQAAGKARHPKSLYKFEVTLRERTDAGSGGKSEFHQLDLGLLDRRLTISAVDAGSHVLPVKARVLGEVNFLAGAPDGRLDLGDSFPRDQDRTKVVDLAAERPGLGLAVSTAETTPDYLKVRLEKIDGQSQWRLRVTVPKGRLIGALPPNSAVVLTTTGPNPRKLRIPVRGTAYDSGGPQI